MDYTIGELAKRLGTSEHTLRYYEKEHLIQAARVNNIRRYTEDDRKWLAFLLELKSSGMSILQLKEFAQGTLKDPQSLHRRIDFLEKQKAYICQERRNLMACYQSITQKQQEYQEILTVLKKRNEEN